MSIEMLFFLEVTLAGLGSGARLSLTALAFVLIYKATRIINLAVSELLTMGAYFSWPSPRAWGSRSGWRSRSRWRAAG